MHPLVTIATQAARAAGNFILRSAERVDRLQVERKARADFVTQVDHGAESEIVRVIRKAYPQHAILAEEGGLSAGGNNEVTWIVDPLDGTTNFLHGLPHYAVSIGIRVRGKLEHGVIYAPSTNDLYCASRGSGATLNSRRIRCTQIRELEPALIGTGVPIRAELLDAYLPTLGAVAARTAGIRRAGSAALDLAYVAAGRLDGFWEMGLRPWDMAAGLVLVQEAGGTITELWDQGEPLDTGNALCAGSKLHPLLAKVIRAAAPKPPDIEASPE